MGRADREGESNMIGWKITAIPPQRLRFNASRVAMPRHYLPMA